MNISVFGLGYVGCVSAACLASRGHTVVGVDVNPAKVDEINNASSPIVEPGLDEMIRETVAAGRLVATTSADDAIRRTELSLVCVGTPSRPNGSLDLQFVTRSCEDIGRVLALLDRYHLVVIRSTMLPGSTETQIIPALERASGKRAGVEVGVAVNPEFLRESTSIADFNAPPFTLIGELDARAGEQLAGLYGFLDAPLFRTDLKTAEMVKYANNAFHGLKVAFANEIGNLCKVQGIDSHRLMEIFCADTKLNLSPYYLKPGFAFGGSCLPKDLRALTYHARQNDVEAPVLDSVLRSNEGQIRKVVDFVLRMKRQPVGILGLSFKAGTDDLRESPMVALTETLLGKGVPVRIYDRSVQLSKLIGANRRYIEHEIPHISSLLRDELPEVVDQSAVIIVGNRAPEFATLPSRLRDGQFVIDLVRAVDGRGLGPDRYWGICW